MTSDKGHVYFPVESLVGLGHFNRTGKIVREIIENGFDVTVSSGTLVDPQRFFNGAHIREIPPYVFRGGPGIHYTLDMDGKRTIVADYNEQARKNERARAHLRCMTEANPDALITEFWPFDRPNLDHEMQAMLAAANQQQNNCLKIVSVRDIVHAPDNALSANARKNENPPPPQWTVNIVNKHYQAVLVHGDPNFIRLNDSFAAAGEIRTDIIYTGYVIDDLPRPKTPAEGGTPAPFLVSCGSGAGGVDMVLSFLAAWRKLLDDRHRDAAADALTKRPLHIVCGPRFPERDYEDVVAWANILQQQIPQEIKVERYRSDFTSLLANASFSLSLAGYNTTLETLSLGTPALFVPNYHLVNGNVKMMSEQFYRLQRLQQKNMAVYAHPETVQNSTLFAKVLIGEFIRQTGGKAPAEKLDLQGGKKTVDIISRMIRDSKLKA